MRRTPALTLIILVLVVIAALALAHKHSNKTNSSTTYGNASNSQAASNNSSQANGAGSSSQASTINIKNMMFTPSQITVAKGGTVTWTNNDSTTHTVVDDLSNVDGPNSGDIAPGQSYSFTFNKTGSFQYHCRIHPSMRGTIVVK